jgi:pre-mRNA cleavage complex 2 protein Pcf11
LNSDIANLIASAKNEFAQNPFDGSIQTRLKALLDLQSILKSQKLPQDQITLIKDQVKQLSASFKSQAPKPAPAPAPAPVAVPQPPPQQTLASLLGDPNALAALLAKANAAQKVPTPPPQNAQPVRRSPQQYIPQPYYPAPPKSAPSAVPNPVNLLDQLRAAGLLRGASSATNTPPIPPLPLPGAFPAGFRSPVPPPATPTPNAWSSMVNASNIPNDVQLKSISLKM